MNKKEAIKTRTIPFVFSDESRDSYGTVLPVKGWDLTLFNKMGVALYNHSSYGNDPDNVIGTARAWVEGNKLLGEITFEKEELNPKAEKVFQKVLAGTLKGCSVGFRPLERGTWGEGEESYSGKTPTYYYGKRALVEISITPMPANSNARVRSNVSPEGESELSGELEYLVGEVRGFEPKENSKDEIENNLPNNELSKIKALEIESRAILSLSTN